MNPFNSGQIVYFYGYVYLNENGDRYSHSESEKITFIRIYVYRGFCYKTTAGKCYVSGHKKGVPVELCFPTLHDVAQALPIASVAYKELLFNELARQEGNTPFEWDKTFKYSWMETMTKLRCIK
jgi:hypothetical protein